MVVEFLEIDDFVSKKVKFYSVFLGGNEDYEFERFLNKDFPGHEEEFEKIIEILEEIAKNGAKKYLFREEVNANALPARSKEVTLLTTTNDFGIRLYCIRLSDRVLVLLNGAIKTTQKAQDCPNVRRFFKDAVSIATNIDKDIEAKSISILDEYPLNYYTTTI